MRPLRNLLMLGLLFPCIAVSQNDTVYFNPTSGNYTIQYWRLNELGERDSLIVLTFEPATKIEPKVQCSVTLQGDSNKFVYAYRIENGANSKQNLLSFFLEFPKGVEPANRTTNRWHNGRAHFATAGKKEATEGWDWMGDQGLEPTWFADGFALASHVLPGITRAYFQGAASITGFPVEPPFEIDRQVARLEVFPANHVRQATVGPVLLPELVTPNSLLDTLLSYTRQSVQLGWLKTTRDDDCDEDEQPNDGIAKNIEKRIEKAKRELIKGDSLKARKELEKLVKKVEKIFKRTEELENAALRHPVKREKKREHEITMTSEAYALLKYNAEYLIDRLPEKKEKKGGKER